MKIPAEFDGIRPFEPEELPQVYERLLADPQFRMVLAYVLPGIPFETVRERCCLARQTLNSNCHSAITSYNRLSTDLQPVVT